MSIFDGVYLYAAYPEQPWGGTPVAPFTPTVTTETITISTVDTKRIEELEKRLAAIEERLDKPLPLADEVRALREMLAAFIAGLARKSE